MYERLDVCPSCGKDALSNDRIIIDHSVSKESFALSRCSNCDLVFTNPRPSEDKLGKYYESDDYISHTDEGTTLINRVYKAVRNITLAQKNKLLLSYVPQRGKLLDIGAGTGHFLASARKRGWTIAGVEPDDNARKLAEKEAGVTLASSLFDIPTDEKYDAITMWHVLEHLPKLGETLQHLKAITTKGSYLLIAVPNLASYDAQHYGEHWAAYDVPRHLYHFTQKSMKALLKRHGFRVKERKPMVFDAYYVSMLSEQYKTGKKGYLSAVKAGWKSNQWAKKNDNEYSSVIYVVTRK